MVGLLEAVKTGSLTEIDRLLSGAALPADIRDSDNGKNIIQIAIENQQFRVIERLLKGLENKVDKSWHQLLLAKTPELAILSAARKKDLQIYELLSKLLVGYSIEQLESVRQVLLLTLKSERKLGVVGALLKSACPGQSLANALNIPEILVGLGLTIGTGILFAFSIGAASLALVGLGIITYSNYQKLKAEQNIEDETLNSSIRLAQLNNYSITMACYENHVSMTSQISKAADILVSIRESYPESKPHIFEGDAESLKVQITQALGNPPTKLALGDLLSGIARNLPAQCLVNPSNLLKLQNDKAKADFKNELDSLITNMESIQPVHLSGKKNDRDLLEAKDIKYGRISLLGDILCTNVGLAAVAALLFTASLGTLGLPWVVLGIASAAIIGITYFYIANSPQQYKELIEQRRAQFDTRQKLYKGFKNFIHNQKNAFLTSIQLLEPDVLADRDRLKNSYDSVLKKKQYNIGFDKKDKQAKNNAYASIYTAVTQSRGNPFLNAVLSGDRDYLKHLLVEQALKIPEKGIVVGDQNKQTTLLHIAIQRGHLMMVEEMLGNSVAAKARMNKKNWVNPETLFEQRMDRAAKILLEFAQSAMLKPCILEAIGFPENGTMDLDTVKLCLSRQLAEEKTEEALKQVLSGIDNTLEIQNIVHDKGKLLEFYNRQDKFRQYEDLVSKTREMLLVEDAEGKLPLHHAAKDPTLYYMLLSPKQLAGYTKAQLDEALRLKNEQISFKKIGSEKWKTLGNAIFESICPGGSFYEMLFSGLVTGLVISSAAVGIVIGIASAVLFIGIAAANYYKGKVENGITEDLEERTIELAYANIIKQSTEKQQTPNRTELLEMQAFIQKINDRPPVALQGQKTRPSDFITKSDIAVAAGTSVGIFLCSFEGVLGVAKLIVGLTTLSITGPLGFGLLLGGAALIGVAAGLYYFYINKVHVLKPLGERRQKAYSTGEEVERIIRDPAIQGILPPSPMAILNLHAPHPGCNNNQPAVAAVQPAASPAMAPAPVNPSVTPVLASSPKP